MSIRNGSAVLAALATALFLTLTAVDTVAGVEEARSDWIEKEKALHRKILVQGKYDLLVVPFQIRGSGLDRTARSLMTRYLDGRLRTATTLRIPSATLVARAFGGDRRVLDDAEIYSLANELGVRTLLVGHAGHDLQHRLSFSIRVQHRPEGGTLEPETAGPSVEGTEVSFTDERPPEEAFRESLAELLSQLPLGVALAQAERPRRDRVGDLEVPEDLLGLCSGDGGDPVRDAYRLQVLGALVPRRWRLRQEFFERSLASLDRVAETSADYPYLKASAYLNLHRRPASVAVLGEFQTADGRALAALQDGDLPSLEAAVGEISSPLLRLAYELERNDLRWTYDRHLVRPGEYPGLWEGRSAWEAPLSLRLYAPNYWVTPSNLIVKETLDRAFPVPGPTAKDLATARLAQGLSPGEGEEVDFAPREHRERVFAARGAALYPPEDAFAPVARDALDLLSFYGDHSLYRRANLYANVQGRPDVALAELQRLDRIYRGQPEFTLLQAEASWSAARRRQGEARRALEAEARDLAGSALLWQGDQSEAADDAYDVLKEAKADLAAYAVFDEDFPRRPYWAGHSKHGDRRRCGLEALTGRNAAQTPSAERPELCGLAINLLYETTGFWAFRGYYDRLALGQPGTDAVGDLLRAVMGQTGPDMRGVFLANNERRFAGHKDRPRFLAELRAKAGDEAGAMATYEEALSQVPRVWAPRQAYGLFLLRRGETAKAAELYQRFPLFAAVERDEGTDMVAVGNAAWEAAAELLYRGAVEEALPLLRVAAAADTGASSEMVAEQLLAAVQGDYVGAAQAALARFRRYGGGDALRDYVNLLHVFGFGEKAWPLFDGVVGKVEGAKVWRAALFGLRLEGKSDAEVVEWFLRADVREAVGPVLPQCVLAALTLDREPDVALADRVRAAVAAFPGGPDAAAYAKVAEGIVLLQQKKGRDALGLLAPALFNAKDDFLREYGLPWDARALVEAGWLDARDSRFQLEARAHPFAAELGTAMLHGAAGDSDAALSRLRGALGRITSAGDHLGDAMYQLLDAADWLYDRTGEPRYRALIVELARANQRADPCEGWAYAFEAKHAEPGPGRRRALAVALYLDRQSVRLRGIPEEEKAAARAWLEENNPFRVAVRQANFQDI